MTRWTRVAVLAAVLATLLAMCAGCAQNAFFELDLGLPPSTGAARHALVLARTDAAFAEDWQGGDVLTFPLAAASQRVPISIEGFDEHQTRPLRLKVRFCSTPRCSDIGDARAPEVRLELERAFYLGERTSFSYDAAIPTTPAGGPFVSLEVVDKCEVAGCREGTTASYCLLDGRHFCEGD